MQLLNQQFFYFLYPREGKENSSLFYHYPRKAIDKDALICRLSYQNERPNQKNRTCDLFTLFDSVNHLCKFMLQLPEEKRCFYEAILGERPQKPHFDIDISEENGTREEIKNSHRIINDLIRAIIQTLDQHHVVLNVDRDLIIYTSHSSSSIGNSKPNKIKKSYHLIINNWCHSSNVEAKAFYKLVIKNMNPAYTVFVDHMVYSTTQQFRILGNRKIGTDRVKTLCRKWKYKNPRNGYVRMIKHPSPQKSPKRNYVAGITESLVSCVHYCSLLPPFISKEEKGGINYTDDIEIYDSDVMAAIQLLRKLMLSYTSRFPFELYRVTGTIISMSRIRSSYCPLCERKHDNDNIYLTINGYNKRVHYHCYRNGEGRGIYLGSLEDEDPNISQYVLDKILGMGRTFDKIGDELNDSERCEQSENMSDISTKDELFNESNQDKINTLESNEQTIEDRPDISLIKNISQTVKGSVVSSTISPNRKFRKYQRRKFKRLRKRSRRKNMN